MILSRLPVLAALFIPTACIVEQRPFAVPVPQSVQVRVTSAQACSHGTTCLSDEVVHQGTLITLDADTISLYAKGRVAEIAIPVSGVRKLEVYRGQKGSAGAAAKGAVGGALLGAALGAIVGATSAAAFGAILDADPDIGEAAAEGAIEFGIAGATTGAFVGATAGHAVWQEVTVHQLRQELCHCRLPAAAPPLP